MKRPAIWMILIASAALIAVVAPTHAQDDTDAPSDPAEAGTDVVTAEVVAVVGRVRVRDAADQPWRKAEPGMEVPVGGEFHTGLRSAVTFRITEDQTYTLDRLGAVRILEAVRAAGDGKVTTKLGMREGRVHFDIDRADVDHDAQIYSPGATMAIRGTQGSYFDQGSFPPQTFISRGQAQHSGRNGAEHGVGAGGTGSNDHSPTGNALRDTAVDTGASLAKDDTEARLTSTLPALGGSDFLASGATGFSSQIASRQISDSLDDIDDDITPGGDFVNDLFVLMGWGGDADLDLGLTDPNGDTVVTAQAPSFPNGSSTTPSGLEAGPDSQFANGFEYIQARMTPIDGQYTYHIEMFQGSVASWVVVVYDPPLQDGTTGNPTGGNFQVGQNAATFSGTLDSNSPTASGSFTLPLSQPD